MKKIVGICLAVMMMVFASTIVIAEDSTDEYGIWDIDEFVDAYRQIAEEAYTTPQVIKEAPHHAALGSRIQEDGLTEWKKFATTWRAYIKMKKDS